jgi:hypothetical protein
VPKGEPDPPTVLFYNRFWDDWPDTSGLSCAHACEFTVDPGRQSDADIVVFHLPTLRKTRLPGRPAGQRWAAWWMESAAYYPCVDDPEFMASFDITISHRCDSTIWYPYFGPPTAAAMSNQPRPKTEPSPVAYLQSSPANRSGRIQYVAALMKRVKIDSYGSILRNREESAAGRPRAGGNAQGREAMLRLISRYKFTIAFENALEPDYVSDKFFDPLIAGSVPIYRGAPNVADFAPAPGCYIDAADFAGPTELAAYINHLDRDDEAYAAYHRWRSQGFSDRFRAAIESTREHPFCRLAALAVNAAGPRQSPPSGLEQP